MKQYKKYVLGGVFVCLMAVALIASIEKSEAFWPFGKAKKENNANYTGAVANTGSNKIKPVSITVVSPNGGETLQGGKNYKIKWKTTGLNKKEKVQIMLSTKTSSTTVMSENIASSTPNNGVYRWKVPEDISGINIFKIGVSIGTTEKGGGWDESDGFFSIAQKGKKVGITVISPNGGEVWKIGEIKTIKWRMKGIPLDAQINVEIFEEGTDKGNSTAIFHGLSATTTTYQWKVGGAIIEAGKKYRIITYVLPSGGGNIIATDTSDNPFLIAPNVMPKSLKVE